MVQALRSTEDKLEYINQTPIIFVLGPTQHVVLHFRDEN